MGEPITRLQPVSERVRLLIARDYLLIFLFNKAFYNVFYVTNTPSEFMALLTTATQPARRFIVRGVDGI